MNYVLKLKPCPNNSAYRCVFKPPNSNLFEKSKLTLPLGLHVLPLFEDSKIGLNVLDDVTVSDTPPWSQPQPHLCLSLTKLKKIKIKRTAQALKYSNKFFFLLLLLLFLLLLKLHHNSKTIFRFFTDGSKVDEMVAAAAVSYVAQNSPFSCGLRDHCSIYTAELQAILFALKHAHQSQESKFLIFSESLSALQALETLNSDHPL